MMAVAVVTSDFAYKITIFQNQTSKILIRKMLSTNIVVIKHILH